MFIQQRHKDTNTRHKNTSDTQISNNKGEISIFIIAFIQWIVQQYLGAITYNFVNFDFLTCPWNESSTILHVVHSYRLTIWAMRTPVYAICEQQRSDQGLRYYNSFSFFIQNFKPVPSFFGCPGWFESTLVTNPEDRFSRDEAHTVYSLNIWVYTIQSGKWSRTFTDSRISLYEMSHNSNSHHLRWSKKHLSIYLHQSIRLHWM